MFENGSVLKQKFYRNNFLCLTRYKLMNFHLCRGPKTPVKVLKSPMMPQSVNLSAEPLPEELQEELNSINQQLNHGMCSVLNEF